MIKNRLINIESSSFCNANCAMCPRDVIKEKGHMSPAMASIIAQKIKDVPNIYEVSISGRGEPTLNPNIEKLLEIFSSLPNLALVTTGARVNDSILEALNKYVSKLRLSISSLSPDIFQKVHTTLDYNKVWGNIENIIQTYDKNKIVIHLVGGPVIYPGLEQTIAFFKERGVDNIKLFPLWNRGGSKSQNSEQLLRYSLIDKYELIAPESDYLSKSELESIQNKPDFCPVGDSSLCINFKGEIVGCFQDFAYDNIVGKITDDTLDINNLLLTRRAILGKMNVCKKCNSFRELVGENAQR